MQHTPSESRAAIVVGFVGAALMIAQQVGAKTVRDALFLSRFGVDYLPHVMLGSAMLAIPSVLTITRASAHWGTFRVVPLLFWLSGGLFLTEWLCIRSLPKLTPIALFAHVAVLGSIVISGFWSLVTERFDPHSAKRAVGRIAGGGALGGLLGGLLAERISALSDPSTMLLAAASLNAGCAVSAHYLGRGRTARAQHQPLASPKAKAENSDTQSSDSSSSAYLRSVALLVLLAACSGTLVDYALKAEASQYYNSDSELMAFFAMLYTLVSLLTFVVQNALVPSLLARFGLGPALTMLPVAVFAFGALGTLFAKLWSTTLLRGVQGVLANSVHRSSYELLYTPLAPRQKRTAKTVIDVGVDRLGDALGGGIVIVLMAVAWSSTSMVLALATSLAMVLIVVSFRLRRGYVNELANSLRAGSVQLEADAGVDATTRNTISRTLRTIDREKIKAAIFAQAKRSHPPDTFASTGTLEAQAFIALCEDLLAPEATRVKQALLGLRDRRATPLVIQLLERDDVAEAAQHALSSLGIGIVGQLADALLDPSERLKIRRRLPRVLCTLVYPRSIRTLTDGLTAEPFEIRYRCARALLRIRLEDPHLVPPHALLLRAAEREIEALPKSLEPPNFRRIDRRVHHIFTLLSVAFDPDAMKVAFRAVQSQNPRLSGTALEYLENVVPENVRLGLWPWLEQQRTGRSPKRSEQQLAEELKRSAGDLELRAIRKQLPH